MAPRTGSGSSPRFVAGHEGREVWGDLVRLRVDVGNIVSRDHAGEHECESKAAEAARAIGFVTAGKVEGGARDIDGHLHDITILAMPLGKYYEWSKY